MRKIVAEYLRLSRQIIAGQIAAQDLVRRVQEVANDRQLSVDERRAAVADLRQDLETQKILKAQLGWEVNAAEAAILRLLDDKTWRAALARCGRVRLVPGRRPTVRARRSQTAQAVAHGADSGGTSNPGIRPRIDITEKRGAL